MLHRGARVCPDHPEINNNLGDALADAGDRKGALQHYAQTVDHFRAAVRSCPDHVRPNLYNGLGWSLWKLGRLEAAAVAFLRAIAPGSAPTT